MKLTLITLLLCLTSWMGQAQPAPLKVSNDPFTREQYFEEYLTVAKLEIASTNMWLILAVIPQNYWRPEIAKVTKPVVQVPAMAFTFVKTIEFTIHKVAKRAPKSFIRYYTPRMRAEAVRDSMLNRRDTLTLLP